MNKFKKLYESILGENKLDFRYPTTLRLNFNKTIDINDEKKLDKINDKLHSLLDDISKSGKDIELDWRDDKEIEIHNIDQNKFFKKYDDSFVDLVSKGITENVDGNNDKKVLKELKSNLNDWVKITDTLISKGPDDGMDVGSLLDSISDNVKDLYTEL